MSPGKEIDWFIKILAEAVGMPIGENWSWLIEPHEILDRVRRARREFVDDKKQENAGPIERAFCSGIDCPDQVQWRSIRSYFKQRATGNIESQYTWEKRAAADYVAFIDALIEAERNQPICETEIENANFREMLRALKLRAWMRQDFREADEIAAAIGDELPSEHERAGL